MTTLHRTLYMITLCLLSTPALADVQISTNPQGLRSWRMQAYDFSLQLIQRLPDQTRAFFLARGFSRTIANDIATHCVLQAIGKNTSQTPTGSTITYRLADWKLRSQGKIRRIKLKSQWDQQWAQHNSASKAARIAFRWATFPSEQTFQPDGDFNWGMITFDLAPGQPFDLQVVWKQNRQIRTQWIKNIICPQDRS